MVEVGRDLYRSSGPTPLLKQGHLDLVAQDHVQMAFEDLRWWRLHNLYQGSVTLTMKVFPDVQREPLMSQFVPLAWLIASGHHWKESGVIFFAPSF